MQDDKSGEQEVVLPLLELREQLPKVIADNAVFEEAVNRIASGTGPIAIDAERASGFRYSQRAYLIQVRRQGAGTYLFDPISNLNFELFFRQTENEEWIIHASTQDLTCLREVGITPNRMFDTELAARLLGYPKVGLSALVEKHFGATMAKEHSAADWSTRPLPEPWLHYAALDVELLIELRDLLHEELVKQNRIHWLEQECAHILKHFAPKVKEDPWRRTSGIHGVKVPRQLAVVRELWLTRNQLAKELDVAPGRLLPDSSIIFAARADSKTTLNEMGAFQGRTAKTHATAWKEALNRARELPDNQCPPSNPRSSAIPHPKNWPTRNPMAHARLTHARVAISKLGESLGISNEHLISPETLRTICWSKTAISEDELEQKYLVRPWQISLILPDLMTSLTATTPVATSPPEAD